jgi:hypothetical protein
MHGPLFVQVCTSFLFKGILCAAPLRTRFAIGKLDFSLQPGLSGSTATITYCLNCAPMRQVKACPTSISSVIRKVGWDANPGWGANQRGAPVRDLIIPRRAELNVNVL